MTAASRKNASITRGRPFAPGNPGRPPGSRHKTTILAEQLMAGDLEAVVARVIQRAKRGDMAAAKLVLDRVAPVRRGRAVRFPLPPVKTPGDVVGALAAVAAAMAAGQVSPEEAVEIAGVVELQRRAIETQELEARLHALEDRFK